MTIHQGGCSKSMIERLTFACWFEDYYYNNCVYFKTKGEWEASVKRE